MLLQKINDPSGDSFVQNPNYPYKDDNVSVFHYKRNKQQDELLGIVVNLRIIFII